MRHLPVVLTVCVVALAGAAACERPKASPAAAGPTSTPPAIVSSAQERDVRTVYDQPFDSAIRLLISATYVRHNGTCCSTALRVLLIDRAEKARQWEIDTIADDVEYDYQVQRVDASAVVVCRTESHGLDAGCVKLFIDATAQRLVRRVAFTRQQDVAFANAAEAQRVLGVSAPNLSVLQNREVFRSTPADAGELPAVFVAHPLPQTTYEAFASARPARVRDGYGRNSKLVERIGAWQAEDGGFWFGRTFYDGEGTTGVGGVGFLSRTGEYSPLAIPALFDWSVDALLVEPDALWAGLVNHSEGADGFGGLLRYDRTTHRTEIHPVPAAIHLIVHLADAVFLGTTRGVYVVRNGTTTWHHMEPGVDGGFVVITESASK